jgi:hypothetical protein
VLPIRILFSGGRQLYNPKKLVSRIKRLFCKCRRNPELLHGFFSLKAGMNKGLEGVDREEFVSNINMIDKKIGLKKDF